MNSDPAKLGQYRSGYAECVNEVTRYLGATSASSDSAPELRTQLVGHLANLCTSSNQQQQQQQQTSPTRTPSPHHHQQQQTPYPQHYAIRSQPQQQVEPVYAETATSTPVNGMSPSIEHSTTHVITRSPVPEGARVDYALTTPVYDTQRLRMSPITTTSSPPPQTTTRVVVSQSANGVTSSLPSGEITLVLPQQALPNGQLPTHFIPVYAQGPVVVASPTDVHTTNAATADVSPRSMSPSSAGNTLPVSPIGACTSPVPQQVSQYYHAQTELSSPVSRELFYPKSDLITACENQCVTKKDAMWRPW